ncbi:MAG: SDR family NAD(P)-dependent oxidoreductase [Thermoguttaceae bacterium]
MSTSEEKQTAEPVAKTEQETERVKRSQPDSPLNSGCDRPIAIITGGSSGLGAEYARQLANRGYDLILTARREGPLAAIKAEIEQQYAVSVETLSLDLADSAQLLQFEHRVAQMPRLDMLINNAGYGHEARFPDVDIDRECKMVQVHAIAPLRLCHAALKPMIAQKQGKIINVSSVAAFLFGPGVAQYMSTKAYLLSFTRCLQCDVREQGIKVQALCPGLVRTGFHNTELIDEEKYKRIPNFLWLQSKNVVRDSLKNLDQKRHTVVFIPSFRYKLFTFFLRSPLLSNLTELIYRFRN